VDWNLEKEKAGAVYRCERHFRRNETKHCQRPIERVESPEARRKEKGGAGKCGSEEREKLMPEIGRFMEEREISTERRDGLPFRGLWREKKNNGEGGRGEKGNTTISRKSDERTGLAAGF